MPSISFEARTLGNSWKALTSPKDADANFMGTGRSYFNVLDLEGLSCSPANSSFAHNRLPSGVGHDDYFGGIEEGFRKASKSALLSQVVSHHE